MSADQSERSALSELALLQRAWPFARPDLWALLVALGVTPLVAVSQLAQPYFLKEVIDGHLVPGLAEGLGATALLFLASVLGAWASEAIYTLALSWAGQRAILRLRTAIYQHVLALPQAFFDQQPSGKLLTRITNDTEAIGEAMGAGAITLVLDILMIAGTLSLMLWMDWRLTVLLLAMAPVLLGAIEFMRRRLRALFLETQEAQASVNAFLAERVDGVAVVQLFGDEARSEGRFAERNQRLLDATRLSNIYDAGMYSLVDGMGSVFVALILWYGSGAVAPHLAALGVEVEPVSVGLLVAFMDYVERLFRPLRELSGKITILQRAAASLSKIQWLLEQPGAQDGSAELPQFRGALCMRGVSFRYRPDSEPILREVDLDVSPGEVVAIVGATGSGKTTLTRLLDRSYEGYEGSIRLDGVELRDIARDPLRRHVIAMRQDVQVFSESLRFNVDLGKSEISEAAREQAVDSAQARPMVERLGWEHPLKDRGADLSVGEGQLLSFARTCAHNPGLLILDEATASVDSLTEARIQAAIAGMLKGRTVMVIAHRLSTIQRADRICVMEAGRIVEQGSHAELMSLGGRYASLVEAGRAALSSPQMEAP